MPGSAKIRRTPLVLFCWGSWNHSRPVWRLARTGAKEEPQLLPLMLPKATRKKEKTGFYLLSFNEPLVPLLADPGVWNIYSLQLRAELRKGSCGSPKSTSTGSFLSVTQEKLGCSLMVDMCPPQRGNPNGLAEELTFVQRKKRGSYGGERIKVIYV